MMKERLVMKAIINVFSIIFMAVLAIVVHAIMPAGVNEEELDGILVKLIGFPAIMVSYFILLFTHCTIVTRRFGGRANLPKLQIGLRFGLVFSMLYLIGMQEVSVETSPFKEWGSAFVNYQFFMGLGDAIPVLLLCMIIAYVSLNNKKTTASVQTLKKAKKLVVVALITITFLVERAIGYQTGIIQSDCNVYPVQCYIWTLLFGIVLGCSYVGLYPVYAGEKNKLLLSVKLVVLTIGLNWIIFNSFIGVIFDGFLLQVFLRSGIDVAVLFLTSIVMNRYFLTANIGAGVQQEISEIRA